MQLHNLTEAILGNKSIAEKDVVIREWLGEKANEIADSPSGEFFYDSMIKILGLSNSSSPENPVKTFDWEKFKPTESQEMKLCPRRNCKHDESYNDTCFCACHKPKEDKKECIHDWVKTNGYSDDWINPRKHWYDCSRCKVGKYMTTKEWIEYNLQESTRPQKKSLAEKFDSIFKTHNNQYGSAKQWRAEIIKHLVYESESHFSGKE